MNKKSVLFLAFVGIILFSACKDEKEDITNDVDRSGAVETSVTVTHLNDSSDVLITKHIVWKNYTSFKTIYTHDTIPALGYENTTGENVEGETKDVRVKKDYEIFITVK